MSHDAAQNISSFIFENFIPAPQNHFTTGNILGSIS